MLTKDQVRERLQETCLWVFIGQLGLLVGIEAVYIAVFAGDERFNRSYGHPSLQTIGLATSLYPICAAVGALSVLYLVHATREIVILATSLYLWLAGYLIGTLLPGNISALMAARTLKGLAIGSMTSALPLYVERAACTKRRAAQLLTLFQASVPLGILMMAGIAKLEESAEFSTKWLQAAIPAFPAVVVLFSVPQKCRADVISSEKQMQDQMGAYQKLKQDFQKLWRSQNSKFRCGAAILAQIAGPLTAINVVFYYSATMCRMLGFENDAADYMALGLYACNFVGTALSLAVINKLPRVATVQYAVLGMGILHGALFVVRLVQSLQPQNNFLGLLAIALLFAFVFVFSFLFAGISLVYTSEVVALKSRGISIGIATAAGWLCNFAVAMASVFLMPLMESFIFLLFAYLCCAMYIAFGLMPQPTRPRLELEIRV
nr:MFS.1 [Starmerella bombicola]